MAVATAELERHLERQRRKTEKPLDRSAQEEEDEEGRLRSVILRLEKEVESHWEGRQTAEKELKELRLENEALRARCQELEAAALGSGRDVAGPGGTQGEPSTEAATGSTRDDGEEPEEPQPVEQVQDAISKLEATLMNLQQKSADLEAEQEKRHKQLAQFQAQIEGATSPAQSESQEQPQEADAPEAQEPAAAENSEAPAPEAGDVVLLGHGVPPEFRQCPGVVIQVAERHCTVAVLDKACRVGVGECWPAFTDIKIICSSFRLGSRVVVDGLRGAKAKTLNGLTGTVSSHPRQGHPTFITKPAAPTEPQFTVCVSLDSRSSGGDKAVLLDTRFVVPFEDYAAKTVGNLSKALVSMTLLSA